MDNKDKNQCDSRFEFVPGKLVQCTKAADHTTSGDPVHGCGLGRGASLNWDDDAAYKGDGGDLITDIQQYLAEQSALQGAVN